MPIRLTQRRKGSLGLEAALIVPFAVMIILLSRFVLEGMLTRHEVAIYTRGSAVTGAIIEGELRRLTGTGSSSIFVPCPYDESNFNSRLGVTHTPDMECSMPNGEQGLSGSERFSQSIRDAATAYNVILRDVDRTEAFRDVQADGSASFAFNRPDFLTNQGSGNTDQVHLVPVDEPLSHMETPYEAATDPVLWDELSNAGLGDLPLNLDELMPDDFAEEIEDLDFEFDDILPIDFGAILDGGNTEKLFPNVFPSRDK